MLLGIVSDTHGHVAQTRLAIGMLESLDVDEVIHCGDVGTAEVVAMFAPWPTHYVFGNTDGYQTELRDAMEQAGHSCHERFGTLEREGRHIAFLHGDDEARLEETIASGQFDMVCSGHTHVAHQTQLRATLALNPGAIYRASPHTIAVVELPELVATHVTL